MKKKYKLMESDSIVLHGRTLYRIKAVRSFGDVKKGELGGYIEKENNLSHKGNCWVYDNAWAWDDARVSGDALVYGNAWVYGSTRLYDNAEVCGNARVHGNAKVYGNARVYGDAEVYGNAKVEEENTILTGSVTHSLSDLRYSIMAQLGIAPTDKMILFKSVTKVKKGVYKTTYGGKDFFYYDGKVAKVKDYDKSNLACSKGIHLSTPLYWSEGDTIIACEVNLKDVITCQRGKVRVKKCKVIGEIFNKETGKWNTKLLKCLR